MNKGIGMDKASKKHRSGIYLDFEGEGKKLGETIPPIPHMAGVYRPSQDRTNGGKYSSYFFNDSWGPVRNGCRSDAEILSFNTFLERLINEAKSEQKTIYYWSCHELMIIEQYADPLLTEEFKRCSTNSLRIARKFANRRRIKIEETDTKGLNNFLSAIAPRLPKVKSMPLGAAESCRRLDRYCSATRKWRKWTEKQKLVARDLLTYNYEDCLALYRVTKKVINAMPPHRASAV